MIDSREPSESGADDHPHHFRGGKWLWWVFAAIALFYLLTEHRAHLFGVLPYLLLLACPLILLLTTFIERGEVQPRRFSTGALNALRTLPWKNLPDATWTDLYSLVRNLALTPLDEEISAEDVRRVIPAEEGEAREFASLLPLLDQPLREARDAFEKLYFEHHLRLEGGNMTKLAERSGLERTHLYRKLKQLDVKLGKRGEE